MGPDAAQEPDSQFEYLWPCNVAAWHAWQSVQTQWRVGTGGATGLDYAGVWAWLHAQRKATPKQRSRWFEGIQAAERATLAVWADQRKKTEPPPSNP